jgi:Rrf2 family protein
LKVRLTRRGDYAVRAMVALARPGVGQLTGAALAAATGIPGSFLPQVMRDLVRAGLVANRRGRAGGYRLARSPEEVDLHEIIEAAEGDARPRTCVLRGGPCRGHVDGPCDVHDAFARAQEAVGASLSAVTLADVTRDQSVHAPTAERATELVAAQHQALEEAVRAIGGELDPDRVLQRIADRVRVLVAAEYAAIGIVGADGRIERFITSGIDEETRRRIGHLPQGRGLLGLIIREARSYRIADITQHPARYGFPEHHPPMTSFLGVPVLAHGVAIGRMYLTNKQGAAEFSAQDQALVETFALHAGIAIDNARLHDQVQRLAVVDERDRISRDLHDSIIQAIYAQTLALDDVPELVDEDPAEARRRVDEAIDALHAVIRDIRNFIFGLRPVLLESGSLSEGLHHLAAELRRNGGIEVTVSVEADAVAPELPLETVAELLAITREALSNVARHARAGSASISLRDDGGGLRLEIADDGRGFAVERAVELGHHGLTNMRARTEGLGGSFNVESAPSGTRIIIALPPDVGGRGRGEET